MTLEEIDQLKLAASLAGGEKAVREEIYAEWLSSDGAVFHNLPATFSLKPTKFFRWDKGTFRFAEELEDGRPNLWVLKDPDAGAEEGEYLRSPDKYVAGLDFGIKDATVWSLFNRRTNEQEAVARFSGHDDYTDIIPAIDKLMHWWGGPLVVFDEGGGHGGAICEHLVRHFQQGIHGRRWSFKSKVADITRAQVLCEKAGTDDGWTLLDVPWQRVEFENFSVETETKQGVKLTHPRFGALPNENDDSVTAACIAATCLSSEYRTTLKKKDPPMWSYDWVERYTKGMARARRILGRRR